MARWEHFSHGADIGVRGNGNSLAEAFEQAGALDRLEGFASFHGADFYGLARNRDRVVLRRESVEVPESFSFGDGRLVGLRCGDTVDWSVRREADA